MLMLPSYTNQSIDLLVVRQKVIIKPFGFGVIIKPFDAPQANQLTGFYMRATWIFNGLSNVFIRLFLRSQIFLFLFYFVIALC